MTNRAPKGMPPMASGMGRRIAKTTERLPRLLLALLVAGEHGATTPRLITRSGGSRSTLYRDLALVRRLGWRLVSTHDAGDGGRAYWRLAARQTWPRASSTEEAR